jgi:hypothetical protein
MATWTLILIIATFSPTNPPVYSISMGAEFNTKEACEIAASDIKALVSTITWKCEAK